MQKLFNHKLGKHSNSNSSLFEVPVAEFVPYACHYSSDTILTKNGELMQIIKITGFSYETVGKETLSLRALIRDAIAKHVTTDKIALNFQTVRRRSNLDPGGQYPENFAAFLNRAWCIRNDWEHQFVNEVYVTLIYQGEATNIASLPLFLESFRYKKRRQNSDKYLNQAYEELNHVANSMLDVMKDFGAKKLGITSHKGVYYSEPITFLNKIMSLEEIPMPVPLCSISDYLLTHKVAFGNSAFEVIGDNGKHFGSIFTIKEYHELSDKVLDQLLQLPVRFLISQSSIFVPAKEAKAPFEHTLKIMNASNHKTIKEITGVNQFEQEDESETAFVTQQTTIMLISDTLEELEQEIYDLDESFYKLGIATVREDTFMEQIFWSQLPANFSYLSRNSYMNAKKLGGLAALNNFPAGKKTGNHWGAAVTVFHTNSDTPYFFNFHLDDVGHTAIIGPYGTGKTVLLNFLLAEARKFNNNLYFFDQMRASKVFIRAIGGYYNIINPENTERYRLNPFLMKFETHQDFLVRWVESLILTVTKDTAPIDSQLLLILLENFYDQHTNAKERSLREFIGFLEHKSEAQIFVQPLKEWLNNEHYKGIFDSKSDYFDIADNDIIGFGMSHLVEHQEMLFSVFYYLLYKIESRLNGYPTIIVLDEAWKLIEHPYFVDKLESWLQRLTRKNAMVIFATESVDSAQESPLTERLFEQIATAIYLPNPKADKSYIERFGLSEAEYKLLHSIDNEKRQFLLKRKKEAIIAKLDLKGMEELDVLSGSDKTVDIMEKAIEEKGRNPDEWLDYFYQEAEHLHRE